MCGIHAARKIQCNDDRAARARNRDLTGSIEHRSAEITGIVGTKHRIDDNAASERSGGYQPCGKLAFGSRVWRAGAGNLTHPNIHASCIERGSERPAVAAVVTWSRDYSHALAELLRIAGAQYARSIERRGAHECARRNSRRYRSSVERNGFFSIYDAGRHWMDGYGSDERLAVPRIPELKSFKEIVHVAELLAGISRLAGQEAKIDESKDYGSDVIR
jgi:hypothetical protein